MANDRQLRTYDPKKISITFGSIIFTGFAEGDFIEVTTEDNFEMQKGADGTENRINKSVTGADINVTLQQTSITNDALSAAFLNDKLTNGGIASFTMKDLQGNSLVFSAQAYIKKYSDQTFGDSLGTRQWNFRLTQAEIFVGGNL